MARMGEGSLVEMVVVRVSPYLRDDRPLLWLGEKDAEVPRLLPIAIGEFEAAAIRMPLDGEEPVRPISYDLLASMVSRLGIAVHRVVIESVHRSVFFAKVVLQANDSARALDSRPSDAIALALRTGAPIFVSQALLDQVGLEPGGSRGDLDRFLERFHEPEPPAMERAPVAPDPIVDDPVPVVPTPPPEVAADPLSQLRSRLQRAVICEEYEEAARLRDQIESLQGAGAE
jgi:uncharacterized protein